MPAVKYIFLGFVQGLTEFLPVSSSAHLVIFQDWLEIKENQILLDIILHLGTLLALVVFLFKDIMKYFFRKQILFYIFLVTAVTALIVMLGKDFFEEMFLSAKGLSLPLLITALVLFCTKQKSVQGRRVLSDLRAPDAFWVGLVQGFAVIPGLSRSGLTISALLLRNLHRETAFKFSFLVSIPAILGACVLKMEDFSNLSRPEWTNIIWGFGAAFFSGLLSLRILRSIMRQARFYLFGYYCLCLALVVWWVK